MSGRPLCICVEPFKREGVWFVNSELLLFQKAACSSTLYSCPSGGGAGEDLSACFCVIMLRSWAWFLWLHLYMEVHWALLLLSDAFLQGDDLGTHTHHPNGPPCASAAYFLQGRREQLNTNQTKASPKHYYPPRVYSQKKVFPRKKVAWIELSSDCIFLLCCGATFIVSFSSSMLFRQKYCYYPRFYYILCAAPSGRVVDTVARN